MWVKFEIGFGSGRKPKHSAAGRVVELETANRALGEEVARLRGAVADREAKLAGLVKAVREREKIEERKRGEVRVLNGGGLRLVNGGRARFQLIEGGLRV